MAGLIESLTEIIGGILNMIQAILTTILSTITGVFSLAGTTVKEGTYATGSVIDFLLSNIVPIGVAVAALVGFSAYQQSRGRSIGGGGSMVGKKRI